MEVHCCYKVFFRWELVAASKEKTLINDKETGKTSTIASVRVSVKCVQVKLPIFLKQFLSL